MPPPNFISHLANCFYLLSLWLSFASFRANVNYLKDKTSFFLFSVSVCLSACLPVCLSVCLPFCLSACLPVCLSACLPVCLSVYLSVCLSVFLSICMFVCLSACLSVCMSVPVVRSRAVFKTLHFLHNLCIGPIS
jgi:hypothetical protein